MNMYTVAAFGNPILDLIAIVDSDELYKKYCFKEDDQQEASAEIVQSLYKDTAKYNPEISAGGCSQNSLRVLQWLLQEKFKTIFFGGIGNDEQGVKLKEIVNKSGVTTKYVIIPEHSTATCIGLVKGSNRCLTVHLGAAEYYQIEALKSGDNLMILKDVKTIYIEGFFLTNRLEVAEYIQNFAIENKICLTFNLCGSYLCDMLPKEVLSFAKNCNILFGSRKEYKTLGKTLGIDDPICMALMLNEFSPNSDIKSGLFRFGKVVVVTDGSKPICTVFNHGETVYVDVPEIKADRIQDTVGAGDAFVAGFLAGLLQGFELKKCLQFGCWSSAQIIQQHGCTIPDYSPDTYME